jgi:nucleotide-binding universal stress UspA family protein
MKTAHVPARQILAGTNGSPTSAAALRWAAAEATFRGLVLHVVYVQDPAFSRVAPYARSDNGSPREPQVSPESTLQTAVQAALGPHVSPALLLEAAEGLPARVLLDRAASAEMLVLGSHRPRTGTRQATGPVGPLGPVARDCLRGAPCPVVVVRPDAGAPSRQATVTDL